MKIETVKDQNKIETTSSTLTSSPVAIKTRSILASGSFDNTVKLWDTATGTCLHSLVGYSNGGVYSIAYDKKAKYIAVGHSDGILCVWNVNEGKIFRKYHIPKGTAGAKESTIYDVSWSSDGNRLGICSTQGKILFVDFKS